VQEKSVRAAHFPFRGRPLGLFGSGLFSGSWDLGGLPLTVCGRGAGRQDALNSQMPRLLDPIVVNHFLHDAGREVAQRDKDILPSSTT
jgi:hypothetical protein